MIKSLTILSPTLDYIDTVYAFLSCIWTTQFYAEGEFELVVEYSKENLTELAIGNFIVKNATNQIAVIEKVRYEYTPDEGGKIIASGRMAISLLDRRIIGSYSGVHPNIITYCANNGNMEAAAMDTVRAFAMTGTARAIPNLVLGTPKGYTNKAKKRRSTFQNLYSTLTAFLATKSMAHRIIYDADTSQLMYEVFKGTNRSSTLVFSRTLENLLSFAYEVDETEHKTWIYVAGEGEGRARYVTSISMNNYGDGLNRKEMLYEASASLEEGETDSSYVDIMKTEAFQECRQYSTQKNIEAEIDLVNSGLEFGVDYNVGDVILISDIIDFKPRITTVIESQSADGYTVDVEFNEDPPEEEEE